MRVKLYQINTSRDKNQVKFLDLDALEQFQGSSEVDAGIYDEVFDGELDITDMEELFRRFNQEGHPLFRGHSLSVSDVAVLDGQAYFCRSVGFEKIDFDTALAQKPENLIRVLYVEPHKAPCTAEIENTLEGQQRAVGGLIEYIYNEDNTIIVINEESKINGMEGNRRMEGDVICGPFFIAGDGGEELGSLTEEQLRQYAERFEKPDEDITAKEIQEHTGFLFMTW